jgi:hypothetical protein
MKPMVKYIFYSTDKLWLKQVAGGSIEKENNASN